MTALDYWIVAIFLAATLAWGARHARRAGSSTAEFFVAGRTLPWWLAGTSIVATTFAADTPLAIAGLVANEGIAGNWFWWADVLPAMTAAFLVAELWRRSGVLTDNEIIELRYGGRRAAGLRLFRALYFGVLRNAIVIGWVNLAMLKILELVLGLDPGSGAGVLAGLFLLTVAYTLLSGLWGVVFTDVAQFALALNQVIRTVESQAKWPADERIRRGRDLDVGAKYGTSRTHPGSVHFQVGVAGSGVTGPHHQIIRTVVAH